MQFVSYIKQQITKYRGIFHLKQKGLFAFENLLVLTASIIAIAFLTLTFYYEDVFNDIIYLYGVLLRC